MTASQPDTILPSKRYLAMSGDILGWQTGEVLLAPSGMLQGQSPVTELSIQIAIVPKLRSESSSRFWWQGYLSEYLGVTYSFKKHILTCFIFIHKN